VGQTDTPIHHLARLFGRRLDQYAADLGPGSVRVLLQVVFYALYAYAPLGLVALVLWALVIWLVPRGCQDRAEALQLRDEVLRLREIAQTSAAVIARLNHDLEVARSQSAAASGRGHPLFRRVGLDADCPRWVAETVRRAYRAKLHPDAHPPSRKAEAERRFKQAEQVFDEVWRLRGF
jgi:hypothetical protein